MHAGERWRLVVLRSTLGEGDQCPTAEEVRHVPSLPQLGLQAGAAGWKAGHEAIRSGALDIVGLDDSERATVMATYSAREAGSYMRTVVEEYGLTQAQGVRLWWIFMGTFRKGALDQALDAGALYRPSERVE